MSDLPALANALRGLLGPGFGIGVADPRAPAPPLFPQEEPATARMLGRRRREFAAGRAATRMAMAELNLSAVPVPMGPDRAPLWPVDRTGSIAHCHTAAIAAVAHADAVRSIGLDIEETTPLEAELWDVVLTPAERTWLEMLPPISQGLLAKQIFSAKEAVYKAQYPLTRRMIGFQEVEISMEPQTFSAALEPVLPGAGRFSHHAGLVISLFCL